MTDAQRAATLARARAALQRTTQGYTQFKQTGKGDAWKAALKELDTLAADLAPPKPKLPALGPVVVGGRTVLEQDLTHATDGVPGYPAFDDGFNHPGLAVIAPETFKVTKIGRFVRRDGTPDGKSVYGTGASGIRWVFGHLENVPAVGATVKANAKFATISPNHEQPHVHVGVNAKALIGHELAHHTNYTHGAATVGQQLAASLL